MLWMEWLVVCDCIWTVLDGLQKDDTCITKNVVSTWTTRSMDRRGVDIPRGINSGGIFLRVRMRCEMVCAIGRACQSDMVVVHVVSSYTTCGRVWKVAGLPLCSSFYMWSR